MALKQYNYNKLAEYYDVLELDADWFYSKSNSFIHSILKKHNVKSVLDFTCGTGAQALYLSRFYKVVASDISKDMLSVAKAKAKKQRMHIEFAHGDVRNSKLGKFDSVITIFNAIGHLTESEFDKAIGNINRNLKEEGIYIFDIFNQNFAKWSLGYKFIDAAIKNHNETIVRFNQNYLDSNKGILKVNQETWIQRGFGKPRIRKDSWDMKIYSYDRLKRLLEKNRFKILNLYGGWGKKFSQAGSLSIVVVAQKLGDV
ncbi:MAG: methyltransferase domain-containing protein [Candidatus Micrarchaeota archaeon]|nr:methyltransferase domain-containing protein [Candidatus Micrarchaeota archaeon]MDE1804325.1 methyltransferase domain-containing protein [Candidatus Micrarchaeota archaeon]